MRDLNLINFDEACHFDNPNEMWQNWVTKFMSIINKHAPLKKKRLGKKKSPWITPEVISKMRQRDSLKKKFDITKHEHIWSQYKKVRNETNNLIKQSQRSYFISNIDTVGNDPKKTWKLIKLICKINLDNKKVVTEATEISDTFNQHFTNIGENLANNIGKSNVNPTQYLKSPNSVFSFNEVDIGKVRRLLNQINTKKSPGLDNIPGNLLKIAADILAPSLTKIFNKSLSTGMYPND